MLLRCNDFSPVLQGNTEINVIIPTPREEGHPIGKDLKVLYLLHGLHGDASSWLHYSNIRRYAQDMGLVVVMPSCRNSFYQDMVYGERFFTYMTQELPALIQGLFPVSQKPEDTYIAGLSMGGYGALYIGLRCPEKFAAIASLSGAVDIGFRHTPVMLPLGAPQPFFAQNCFGDIAAIAGSDRDIFTLFEKAKALGRVPRIYQSCGTADYLYEMNRLSHEKLTQMGAQIDWHEIPGLGHVWDLWDAEIPKVIRWMLQETDAQ